MNGKAANGLIPQTFMQNIGDAEIASLRYEGEGPLLIFLHATGFLPWLWHPVARELAGDVNKSVHQNPWPYIAGTAATAVLVGFLLGRSRK
jgi:hypothetical protein